MIRGKKSKEEWEKQTRGYRMTSVIALGLIAVFVTYILIAFAALRVLDGFGYDISKLQDPRIALLNIFLVPFQTNRITINSMLNLIKHKKE